MRIYVGNLSFDVTEDELAAEPVFDSGVECVFTLFRHDYTSYSFGVGVGMWCVWVSGHSGLDPGSSMVRVRDSVLSLRCA